MFPDKTFSDIGAYAAEYSEAVRKALASLDMAQLGKAAETLEAATERGSSIFVCGNGGSAAISNHFLCDHMKGVRNGTDFRPKVTSISSNIEILTAIANDMSYEKVFEFQLSSLASPGDVLVAISSSGSSPNILAAIKWAKYRQVTTIAMTGFSGGESRRIADIAMHVDASNYGVVEDVHQSIMHMMAQYIRHRKLRDPALVGKLVF